MKFDVGNSVLLGSVLGQIDGNNDSSKVFYNNWNERQQQFGQLQINSSSQFPKQINQTSVPSIPNHNNIIMSNNSMQKGSSLSHHHQIQGTIYLEINNARKKAESGFQIANVLQNPCKICSINKSLCSLCVQKQTKFQRPLINPKRSESFQTNTPLFRQQYSLDQGKLNNSLLINNQFMNQQNIAKRNEIKKLSITLDSQNKQNSSNNSFQVYKQDGLKLKLMKNSKNNGYSSQSTLENDNTQIQSTDIVQKTLPSTEVKSENTRRQYFSQHTEETSITDEKILNDNYMKYILGIKQDEGDNNPQEQQSQNQNVKNFQSNKLNQLHQVEKSCINSIIPILIDQNNTQNQKNNNSNLLNKNNIKINSTNSQLNNDVKQPDTNNTLTKQKSSNQHVNTQLVLDANQIKIKHLMNATNLNLNGRSEVINKKKLKYDFYIKEIENKQKNISQTQIPIIEDAQLIQDLQNKLKKTKKSVIYSKIKPQNLQGSPSQIAKNNISLQMNENDIKISLNYLKDTTLNKTYNTQTFQNEYCNIPNVSSLSYNEEYQSNTQFSKSLQQDNSNILDEQDINDEIEEEYYSSYLVSDKKKNKSEQYQRYVGKLKSKSEQQNKEIIQNKDIQIKDTCKDIIQSKEIQLNKDTIQSQDSILNQSQQQNRSIQYKTLQLNHRQINKNEQILNTQNLQFGTIEKENKRLSSSYSQEAQISSLALKSSDLNIFNFKYRKNNLKSSASFNNSYHNQSVDQSKQIDFDSNESQDQQKNHQEKKINQVESVQNHDALPISFPKLQGPAKKRNPYLIQNQLRNDISLHAQKIIMPNRLDKQTTQEAKETFYGGQINKKQNENIIKYNEYQDKYNKLSQKTLPISSSAQIRTEGSMNDMDNSKINIFMNKNRISLQDISFQDKLGVRHINEIQQQDYSRQKSVSVNIQGLNKDTIEWKNSLTNQLTNKQEKTLIEKALVSQDDINTNKLKNKKIIKVKGFIQQQKQF